MLIANPIYDVVFKHLLEDLDVARTMLTSLLDMEVLDLLVQPHEWSSPEDNVAAAMTDRMLRIYRIDFAATVLMGDGQRHRVIIELQKAVAPDFIGRFRRYLGRQYQIPIQRVAGDAQTRESRISGKGHLPIIGVYLFGFTLSEAHPKVVRVKRQYLHYSTMEVIHECIPAMELLTHDAVMVQLSKAGEPGMLPVDQILRLFDQAKCADNAHYVKLDDDDDQLNSHIVKKMVRILAKLASDPETQEAMAVEDEVVDYVAQLEKTEVALKQAKANEEDANRQKLAAISEFERMREAMKKAGLDPDNL